MGKKVVIKTHLKGALGKELVYCGQEPYGKFPVSEDGTVNGLSMDHPRFALLQFEWKLEVIEVDTGESKKDAPESSGSKPGAKAGKEPGAGVTKEVQ